MNSFLSREDRVWMDIKGEKRLVYTITVRSVLKFSSGFLLPVCSFVALLKAMYTENLHCSALSKVKKAFILQPFVF